MSTKSKYLFDCINCKHTFTSALGIIKSGCWCPYCSSNTQLCEKEDCNWCYKKSFANHPKAKYWSKTNKVKPWHVSISSGKKFAFDCNKCKNTFTSALSAITTGTWCPHCSINTAVCGNIKCNWCRSKSFENHPKSQYWSKKNKLLPWQVTKSTNKKYLFDCNKCKRTFIARIADVTSGTWCPGCKNKTEKILCEWLDTNCEKEVTFQPRYKWCNNSDTERDLPFDYSVEKYKLIIELDGGQHFKQVSNWQAPAEALKRDLYKTQCALKNGYTVIRLLQMDVFENKNNWDERFLKHLHKHSKPQVILLDNDGEYDPLRKALTKSQSYNLRTINRSKKTRVISVSSSEDDEEPEDVEPKSRKRSGMVGKAKANYDNNKSKRSS